MNDFCCSYCGRACKNKGGLTSHQKACKSRPAAPPMSLSDIDTAIPNFAIAAAKQLQQDPEYFPGKDYPDREVWLKIRAAQHDKAPVRVVYSGLQPFAIGINAAKRMADAGGNPKHTRGKKIVRHRHRYYHERYEGKS